MKKIISGKVRDVYEVDEDRLVIVTTDRISAFDVILPKPVPDKGRILNIISGHWFRFTASEIQNHILSYEPEAMPSSFLAAARAGRAVLVRRVRILPYEFIVRGYMFGSMWEAYRKDRTFCGQQIGGHYQLAQRLDTPVFTPSTKASAGHHDEYIPVETVEAALGKELTQHIKNISLKLYEMCYNEAYRRGIIIADTKFEFGLDRDGRLILADELCTPDSSRFWNLADYAVGSSPKSYDKQLVRDWLADNKKDGEMPFDSVPDSVLAKTAEIYRECLRRITHD